jgi:lysophospholipase L1-like esterase
MKKWTTHIVSCLLLLPLIAKPQWMAVNDNSLASRYSFVRPVYNKISNAVTLDSFFRKLYLLKKTNNGNVSIVHIGDSHIQADFLSGTVRAGLQDFFGNAGRGLVFPYQLAKSNAPQDINSSSNATWQFNRVAHPEIALPYGVSGYGIVSNTSDVTINLSLKEEGNTGFNKMKFFLDNDTVTWRMKAGNNDSSYLIKRESEDTVSFYNIATDNSYMSFSLSSSSAAPKEFYGVSLENSNPGIIYHTIGVNGARYDQYNIASLFWKQLPALKADLYIVSLGTNEAQAASFSEIIFTKELTIFIEKLKQSSPDAAIIITTAPDSYKSRRYYNTVLRSVNTAISNFCNRNMLPLWNLYQVTGGYKSAYGWSKRGLMSRDKVHFTAQGYRLQGALLLAAISKGYNSYVSAYPDN